MAVTTDDSDSASPTDEAKSDREIGEMLADSVEEPVADVRAKTDLERIGEAQIMALMAIYHEMRHGHDLSAIQNNALIIAFQQHTDTLDGLRRALLGHAADPLSPYCGRN